MSASRLTEEPAPCSVHRCRFVDFNPSAITAVAFPPLPLPTIKRHVPVKQFIQFGMLAVGHANGNIDLSEWTGTQPLRPAPQAWVVCRVCHNIFPFHRSSVLYSFRHCQDHILPRSTLWHLLFKTPKTFQQIKSQCDQTSGCSVLEVEVSL
jgi:hypothetical protein